MSRPKRTTDPKAKGRMRAQRQLYYDHGLCIFGCGRDRRPNFRTCADCCKEIHTKYPKVIINGKETRRKLINGDSL